MTDSRIYLYLYIHIVSSVGCLAFVLIALGLTMFDLFVPAVAYCVFAMACAGLNLFLTFFKLDAAIAS